SRVYVLDCGVWKSLIGYGPLSDRESEAHWNTANDPSIVYPSQRGRKGARAYQKAELGRNRESAAFLESGRFGLAARRLRRGDRVCRDQFHGRGARRATIGPGPRTIAGAANQRQ